MVNQDIPTSSSFDLSQFASASYDVERRLRSENGSVLTAADGSQAAPIVPKMSRKREYGVPLAAVQVCFWAKCLSRA